MSASNTDDTSRPNQSTEHQRNRKMPRKKILENAQLTRSGKFSNTSSETTTVLWTCSASTSAATASPSSTFNKLSAVCDCSSNISSSIVSPKPLVNVDVSSPWTLSRMTGYCNARYGFTIDTYYYIISNDTEVCSNWSIENHSSISINIPNCQYHDELFPEWEHRPMF